MLSFSQLEFSLAPSVVEKPPGRDSVLEALARATSSSSRAQPLWPRRFVLNGRLVFAPPPAARNIMLDAIEALERHVATSPVVITAGAGASFQVSTLLRTAVTNVGINGSAGGATRSDALRIDRRSRLTSVQIRCPVAWPSTELSSSMGLRRRNADSVQRHHADVPEHRHPDGFACSARALASVRS